MDDAREAAAAEPTSGTGAGTAADTLSFEVALERLEGVVDRLERGELELEDALAAFEEGVALTRRCAGQLEAAERRVEELVRDGERWLTRPFASDAAAEDSDAPDEDD